MTRGELIDLACLKTHRTDDASRSEAGAYVKARYEMIWNAYLWRDALCEVLIPVNDVAQTMILPGIVDRVVNVVFDAMPLSVEAMQIVYRADFDRINSVRDPEKFTIQAPSAIAVDPDGSQLRFTADDAGAFGKVSIRGMSGNEERSETISLNGLNYVFSVYEYDVVLALAKASAAYALHVTDVSERPLLDLEASETARAFQRISLLSIPRSEKTISILAKRRCKPLVEESDSTELTGIDNAVLAMAIGDMLEGQRQYAKAQAKFSEAGELVAAMTRLEREQSASTTRIIPTVEDYDWRNG
jgi:hypothetical protein